MRECEKEALRKLHTLAKDNISSPMRNAHTNAYIPSKL